MSTLVRTIEERDGRWLRIILDRAPGNLLSRQMVRALATVLGSAASRRRVWATVEGAGDDFSFGAMIQEHLPGTMEHVLPETHAMLRQLMALPCATAALVGGRCLGGGFELALACDLIIAADDAILGVPEIALGAFPPAAAALLPLRVGASQAALAILQGDGRSAAAWRDTGLVFATPPRQRLIETAGEWFDAHLGRRSAVAIGAAAQAARLTLRAAAEPAMAAAERLYLEGVLPTDDASEGVRAFVEKRAPVWKHS